MIAPSVVELENEVFLPYVCELVNEGHTVSIRARGYSMRPFIEHDRDDVVLGKTDTYKVGDVALAEVSTGHFILHRIDAMKDDKVRLRGDGNYPGVEYCRISDLRAVMVQVIRKGRTWNADGKVWRCYSRLWVKCLPVRRYLLALYKLLWLHQLPARITKLFNNQKTE